MFAAGERDAIDGWRKRKTQVAAFYFISPDAYALRTASPGASLQHHRAASAAIAPHTRLGTGHDAREYSYVSDAAFERRTGRPDEIEQIRYDR